MKFKHTFAISAYGESRYLEACIEALKAQSVKASVIICTSTPNERIRSLAEKYELRLFVREGKSSLKDDWNFAIETAVKECGAEYVTVAHQDDLYHKNYLRTLALAAKKYPDLSVFCTRYRTIGADGMPLATRAESVKRILRLPLRCRRLSHLKFIKMLPLMFGNGIGCPTCSYHITKTGLPVFEKDYKFVIDWETLLRLAKKDGRFICAEKELVDYRVHPEAETRKNIENHNREREESEIYAMIWPRSIVALLMHFYKKAYKDYDADAV